MKKAILYVFSGTGNTLAAADMIAGGLEGRGVSTRVFEIRRPRRDVPDPNDFDIIGFGYPIHAFNTPKAFLNFVKTLPEAKGKYVFFFKTSGEPFTFNSASSYLAYKAAKKRGMEAAFDMHMLMPYNIMFRYKDDLAKQMYTHTWAMAELAAQRIVQGEHDKLHYSIAKRAFSCFFRIQWFGAWINGPLYRVKKSKCTKCGKCVRECPMNNIRIEGKLRFGSHCAMCMRCAMGCPSDAMRIGFLNPWRVNGRYDYLKLYADESLPGNFINDDTKGYFRLFRKYYRITGEELARRGISLRSTVDAKKEKAE